MRTIINKSIFTGLLLASLTLSGCSLLPEPVSLIQAPNQTSNESQIGEGMVQVAKRYLPQGTSLYVPDEPVGMNSIIEADLNHDGHDELIAFYKTRLNSDKIGALILQQKENNWERIGDITGTGYDISWGSATDITGDGKPELLLGWKMGVSSGSILDVYEFSNEGFNKLTQINFHELDIIFAENTFRVVTWARTFADIFDIEIWKWEQGAFRQDQELYESYFSYVSNYYKKRLEEAPDAPYYYYYLADSLLKANQPDSALDILNKGMSQKVTVPSFEEFISLQEEIEAEIKRSVEKDYLFYETVSNITFNIPKELSGVMVESGVGNNNEYVVQVNAIEPIDSHLFSIEVYSKDFVLKEDLILPIVVETDQHYMTIRRNDAIPESLLNSSTLIEEMIASIRTGSPFTKHQHLEEQELIKMVHEAYMKKVYVSTGGKIESETLETFTTNEMEYRYMGTDLDTLQKFTSYLSEKFTSEAIQSFMKSSNIIEHKGRLAQPNADGGSLLDYSRASIVQVNDLGTEKQIDLKVPIGNTLTFEIIPIVLMKTEEGWRISSNPITF